MGERNAPKPKNASLIKATFFRFFSKAREGLLNRDLLAFFSACAPYLVNLPLTEDLRRG